MILPSICYIIESTSLNSGISLFKDFIYFMEVVSLTDRKGHSHFYPNQFHIRIIFKKTRN